MTKVMLKAVFLALTLVLPFSSGFFQSPTNTKPSIPDNYKVLILPGFGNDSVDYTNPSEKCLVTSLKKMGWADDQISVLPVERSDWLQVFLRGALDLKFWAADAAPTRPAFRWYLDRVADYVENLQEGEKVLLLGHSAGGWLARAAVGYGNTDGETAGKSVDLQKIGGFVSLGAPHLPPPEGVMDMTRGALRLTNENFPGCYHSPSSFYVTVCGLGVTGVKQEKASPFEPATITGFAYNSYEIVCGDGTAIGDGVVPQQSSHLDGSIQLDLEGVLHSINAPDNWYGASDVIGVWHKEVLSQIASTRSQTGKNGLFAGKMF